MGCFNKMFSVPVKLHRRRRLKNKSFSLIANNCVGTFMCHDLGLQFKSPFVNLWIKPHDYIKLLSDLEGYLGSELTFVQEENITHPVGLLKDVKIYFTHYATQEAAREKWYQRLKRLDKENLFVMFVEIRGTAYEDLAAFDKLPFANKVMLTHREYPEFSSAVVIPGYRQNGYVGNIYHYKSKLSGIREYDAFNYVNWFNAGKTEKE